MKVGILICVLLVELSLQYDIYDCINNCKKNSGCGNNNYGCMASVNGKCHYECENDKNLCLNGRYSLGLGQNCKCTVDCISEMCYDGICCKKPGAGTNNLNECCSKDGYNVPISSGVNYNCY